MNTIRVTFVSGEVEEILSSQAFFEGGFLHVMDDTTGIMYSWYGGHINQVVTTPIVQPEPELASPTGLALGQPSFTRGPTHLPSNANTDIADVSSIPPGATLPRMGTPITNEEARVNIQIPMPPPAASGMQEIPGGGSPGGNIREAVRLRRMR